MASQDARHEDTTPAFTTLETLTAVIIVGVLALALGLVALTMPAHVSRKQSVGYTQSGAFDYSASAPASSIYGTAGLRSGQPILLDAVGPVTARFTYTLEAPSALDLHGTTRMVATVKLAEGLSRQFTVAAPSSFSGARATIAGTLPIATIRELVTRAQGSLADAGPASATVTLQPTVAITGTLAGHRLSAKYAPALPFTLSGNTMSIGQGMDASASPDRAASDPLKPTAPGKVDYRATRANTLSLLVVHPTVALARALGIGLALFCLLLALWLARPLLGSRGPDGASARINTLYGSRIIEVSALSAPAGPVADVASIDALADLAKHYESMIMHLRHEGFEDYLVWDNGMTYRYRVPTPRPGELGVPAR